MPTVLGRSTATGQVKLRNSDGSIAFAKWHGNAEPAVGSSVEYDSRLGTATSKVAVYGGQVPQPLRPSIRSSFNIGKDKNDVDYANGDIWDIDKDKKKAKFSVYRRAYSGAKWYAPDPAGGEVFLPDTPLQPSLPAAEVDWPQSFSAADLLAKTRWEDSLDVGGTSISGQGSILAMLVGDKRTTFSALRLKGNVETVNNGFDGVAVGVLRSSGKTLREIETALQTAAGMVFQNASFPGAGTVAPIEGISFELTFRFKTFEATGLPFGMREYEYNLTNEQLPIVEPGECFVILTSTIDEQYHLNGYWSVEEASYA